jgi:hypothetical protein
MAGGQCHWLVGWLERGWRRDDATNPSHGWRYVVLVVVGFGVFFLREARESSCRF